MPVPADLVELTPSRTKFRDDDEGTSYWLRGDSLMYRVYPVKGADIDTFRFFRSGFAKDKKHCYCCGKRLSGGNGPDLRPLNYTYATDGKLVWTMGGQVKDADAGSFEVCDDGFQEIIGGPKGFLRVPHGYAKDKDRVYYYDFDGKPNWVRKATPASFVSLNDGDFGFDENFVFCGAAVIPKAKVGSWHKLGGREGHYSTDGFRVFYGNREVEGADPITFQAIRAPMCQLARNRGRLYENGRAVSAEEFEGSLRGLDGVLECSLFQQLSGDPFRPIGLHAGWLSVDVVDLAKAMEADRAFDRLPILADALADAGCDDDAIIRHCRGGGPHRQGCWVVDLILASR